MNNISVISWRSVFLVEETGVHRETTTLLKEVECKIVCRCQMMFVSINSSMTGVISGAVTPNPSAAYKFTLEFSGVRVAPSLVFYVVFCRWLFVLLPFSVSLLYCLTFDLRFLITPSNHFSVLCSALQKIVCHFCLFSFRYCIGYPSIYGFLLPYQTICRFHVVLCRSVFAFLSFLIAWLYCLSFNIRLLITPLSNC